MDVLQLSWLFYCCCCWKYIYLFCFNFRFPVLSKFVGTLSIIYMVAICTAVDLPAIFRSQSIYKLCVSYSITYCSLPVRHMKTTQATLFGMTYSIRVTLKKTSVFLADSFVLQILVTSLLFPLQSSIYVNRIIDHNWRKLKTMSLRWPPKT